MVAHLTSYHVQLRMGLLLNDTMGILKLFKIFKLCTLSHRNKNSYQHYFIMFNKFMVVCNYFLLNTTKVLLRIVIVWLNRPAMKGSFLLGSLSSSNFIIGTTKMDHLQKTSKISQHAWGANIQKIKFCQ